MLDSRIKELRLKSGLTMLQLGHLINIGESTISLYESGKRQPSYDVLKSMALVFRCSTDYLLGTTDDPTPIDKKTEAILDGLPLTDEQKIIISNLSDEHLQELVDYAKYLNSKQNQ